MPGNGVLLAEAKWRVGSRLWTMLPAFSAVTGATVPASGNTSALNSNVYAVDIHPWLRAAIGDATPCEFANPTSLMRLASDVEGRLDLESGIIAHPTINVVEAF